MKNLAERFEHDLESGKIIFYPASKSITMACEAFSEWLKEQPENTAYFFLERIENLLYKTGTPEKFQEDVMSIIASYKEELG